MSVLASALLFALTRAEIVQRFKAPVITKADGLVKVYSCCPEDMRREYQIPIASFAGETVRTLCRGTGTKLEHSAEPGIMIFVGSVRTNLTEVVTRVSTNRTGIVTRLFVKSPGYADLCRLKLEVVKGYFRAVEGKELDDAAALAAYRAADPEFRVQDLRLKLERWMTKGEGDDEECLALKRKVIKPGVASRRDVLNFASSLELYPEQDDQRFAGSARSLTFREAIDLAEDPYVRKRALEKAPEMSVYGAGRSLKLRDAAYVYMAFLLKLSDEDSDREDLVELLDGADRKLQEAMEEAQLREEGKIR